jgi:hypothetical protein
MTAGIKVGAFIIGIIALLVAGIGNIMVMGSSSFEADVPL